MNETLAEKMREWVFIIVMALIGLSIAAMSFAFAYKVLTQGLG